MTSEHSTSQPQQSSQPTLEEMIDAISKTFMVAHVDDTDAHLAQALVYNAGRLAWRMREQGLSSIDQKTSVSDVVTEADRAAERFVANILENLRPNDGIVGEEGAERESTSGRYWVIDPVDGTYNFSSGSDYWCSALALVEGNPAQPTSLLMGAVHRPAMGYTWFGGKDFPTTRDGKEVLVKNNCAAAATSLVSYLHPRDMSNDGVRETWLKAANRFATVRMLGAGSIDLSSIADGSWGAWMQHSVADWDWLPGKALVEAAGGIAKKIEAGGVVWCVAGNAEVVAEIESAISAESLK